MTDANKKLSLRASQLRCRFTAGYAMIVCYTETNQHLENLLRKFKEFAQDGQVRITKSTQEGKESQFLLAHVAKELVQTHLLDMITAQKQETKNEVSFILKSSSPIKVFAEEREHYKGTKFQKNHEQLQLLRVLGTYMRHLTEAIGNLDDIVGPPLRLGRGEGAGIYINFCRMKAVLLAIQHKVKTMCRCLHFSIGIPFFGPESKRGLWNPQDEQDMIYAILHSEN